MQLPPFQLTLPVEFWRKVFLLLSTPWIPAAGALLAVLSIESKSEVIPKFRIDRYCQWALYLYGRVLIALL
jgi:hypothetical protein